MSDFAPHLAGLTAEIAPPDPPLHAGPLAPVDAPSLPLDVWDFARTYGSGFFEVDGDLFLEVLNPFASDYWPKQHRDLDNFRRLRQTEGEGYAPYPLYPDRPGLLLWGYGEDRKHFFWLTEGKPSDWPIIAAYDLEIFTRFDGPMVSFVKQLLCGEIDCGFLGREDERIDPSECEFISEVVPV